MENELLPLLAAMPLLTASAVTDLRDLRIPNTHVLALVVLAVVALILGPADDVGPRLAAAAVTFGIGFALFSLRLVGGGDVKMLPVLMLLVPTHDLASFLQMFSASLMIGSLAKMSVQNTAMARASHWRGLQKQGRLPMAVCFLGAVMAFLGWRALLA